jgi:hypothetical protein
MEMTNTLKRFRFFFRRLCFVVVAVDVPSHAAQPFAP